MPNEPVQSPEPTVVEPDPRWDSQIALGRALRLGALAIPLIISVGFALALIAVLPAPADSGQSTGWWVTVGFAVLVVAVASDRVFQRFAPVVSLPILELRWPHALIVTAAAAVGIGAALTVPDGPPALIAYANLETAEDTALSVTIGEGDPPDRLTIVRIDGPATARWTGTDIVVTGNENANGDVIVVYEACWDDDCSLGELFATFTPVNDAPVAATDRATATAAGAVTLQPLMNDLDFDEDDLAVESAEVVAGRATVEVAGNDLVVTPDDDEPQTIDLTYVVSDGVGGRGEGTAQVIVPDFNEPPVAVDDIATVIAGETVEVDVLQNDSDPDGDLIQLLSAAIADPSSGSAEIVEGSIRFTAALITGTAEIRYEVGDGARAATGLLTVTVDPPEPEPADDQATTREDNPVTFNVISNDLAPASEIDPSSVRVLSATLGSANANADGSIRFSPAPDAYGIGSVTYEVCNTGIKCGTARVEVQIDRVNDAPTFQPGTDILVRSNELFSRQWATNLDVGEDNEPTQSVSFIVSAADPSLFATPPSIDENGVLRFNAGSNLGSTLVTVFAFDGQDRSSPQTFWISVS